DVVAVVLVHSPGEAVHDLDHALEIAVQMTKEGRRRHPLGHRRESADVAEEDGHLPILAAEAELAGLLFLHDRARHRRRDEASEGALRPRHRLALLDEQIAERDDPPERRRYDV